MSKTLGNVIDPVEVIESHGLDAFRYFLLDIYLAMKMVILHGKNTRMFITTN